MRGHSDSELIGDIVAADFRAADVFERFGIDFSRGGRRSLDEACQRASVDRAEVSRALDALSSAMSDEEGIAERSVPEIIDHIVSHHHLYVRSAVPAIARRLEELEAADGGRHPELEHVRIAFQHVTEDLLQHIAKEEHVLFPFLRELARRPHDRRLISTSPFGTVENPIRMMEREHRQAADDMRVVRALTRGYAAPAEDDSTYRLCMAELTQFEADLHRHVHLENNVLFPRALEMERALLRL